MSADLIIREKLERLLLVAGELRLFPLAALARGFGFQRQITPAATRSPMTGPSSTGSRSSRRPPS